VLSGRLWQYSEVHTDVLLAVQLAKTMLSTKPQHSATYFALYASQAL
jgi:hypothetical protein